MDQARRAQFSHLEAAKRDLLTWATANAVPLVHVEFVVPFVETDFGAAVWLFFDTDANVARCANTGVTTAAEGKFRASLADAAYPPDWLAATSFHADSRENVDRNFEGSYFYRLR